MSHLALSTLRHSYFSDTSVHFYCVTAIKSSISEFIVVFLCHHPHDLTLKRRNDIQKQVKQCAASQNAEQQNEEKDPQRQAEPPSNHLFFPHPCWITKYLCVIHLYVGFTRWFIGNSLHLKPLRNRKKKQFDGSFARWADHSVLFCPFWPWREALTVGLHHRVIPFTVSTDTNK